MATRKTQVREEAEEKVCEERRRPSLLRPYKAFKSALYEALPEEFWEHRRAARREMLLAVRSLIDAAIERVEQEGKPRRRRARKIEVE